MNEYFRFLAYMGIGLFFVTWFLRKMIDSMLTDWNPAAHYSARMKRYLNEKMEQREVDAYRMHRTYK